MLAIRFGFLAAQTGDELRRSDGMQLVSDNGRKSQYKIVAEPQGLAEWVLRWWRSRQRSREEQSKQMQVLETLSLGGKRHLLLISCGGERFLVGGSQEGVETIVRVASEASPRVTASDRDSTCQ